MTALPSLTIGIISCNRLHFLRALIESLRLSLGGVQAQWVVVDNASVEEGLQDYLRGLDFIDELVLQPERKPTTEFVTAQNILVERATGEYLLALTDDIQFIRTDAWLPETLKISAAHPQIGSIVLDGQRRKRLERIFPGGWRGLVKPTRTFKLAGQATRLFSLAGHSHGITPSAANGITRLSVWKQLGPFAATRTGFSTQDTSGGAETLMLENYDRSGLKLERCLLDIPAGLTLFTNPHGTQARIRGNKRYGGYQPPSAEFYFKMLTEAEIGGWRGRKRPVSFEEAARPQGFALPLDAEGNLVKHSIVETEFEWVHPSVAGQEF